ncbi:uncharacterized protein LOC135189362 [Pogoniulus pusillus]|uniref:uncharacterized protein LOC135189362 n=1 Tax=Pogoniulus pusillus TaxID=488313 RepID=UPI0030B9A706
MTLRGAAIFTLGATRAGALAAAPVAALLARAGSAALAGRAGVPFLPHRPQRTTFRDRDDVVTIWDTVATFILGQLEQDKAVQVPGLGTFAMLQEQLCRHQEDSPLLRRPSFWPDMAQGSLQGMAWHSEGSPGDPQPKALNTSWLSRATSLPQKVVEGCLKETLLLFSLQLQAGQEVAFTFKDLGVLCRFRDLLCLRFYPSCVARLEPKATMGALLRTMLWLPQLEAYNTDSSWPQAGPAKAFPRFRFLTIPSVAKAFSRWHKNVSTRDRTTGDRRRGSQKSPGQPLEIHLKGSSPVVPKQDPGRRRQQDQEEKAPGRSLPQHLGSSCRPQKPSPAAHPTAELPAAEANRRALKEVWEVAAEWQRSRRQRQEQWQQEKTTWGFWRAGKEPGPAQQPKVASRRWMTCGDPLSVQEQAAAAQQKTLHHPDLLPPRATQVLRSLEGFQARREIYSSVAQSRRRQQQQQSQRPCARWLSHGGGGGARSC